MNEGFGRIARFDFMRFRMTLKLCSLPGSLSGFTRSARGIRTGRTWGKTIPFD